MSAPKEAQTEQEMREADVPWPETLDDLTRYIAGLVEREHDYGTCVYAMSMAATAAFGYVAKRLGVTGFQASCADMDILRRTRHMEHGFILLKADDLLYPQYDLPSRLAEWIEETRTSLAPVARQKIAEASGRVHPKVLARWKEIAALTPTAEGEGEK